MLATGNDRGITLNNTGATGNVIRGNIIGTNAAGTLDLGNVSYGIYITLASGNTVGGSGVGEGNTLAFNSIGVYVNSSGINNALRGNSLFSNDALGIDLSPTGVNANDTGDVDTGSNNKQNYPVLTSASSNTVTTTVAGSLNSTASTQFNLDFFYSPSCDASGKGEGKTYLGSGTATTDGTGNVTFNLVLNAATPNAQAVTGTATDPSGNTSEFSGCVTSTVTAPPNVTYNWHYTYDNLSRVTSACSAWTGSSCPSGKLFTYEYDGAGNLKRFDRFNKTTSAVDTVRYVYNGANQIKCVDADSSGTCNGAEFLWVYDAYGNLTNDGTSTYTYDAAMRLVSTTVGGVTTTYTYNGDGDRVSQTVGSTTTTYVLDIATPLTMVLAETTGSTTIKYLHGLGLVAQSDGTNTNYLLNDGLGSVRQVVDSAGWAIEPYLRDDLVQQALDMAVGRLLHRSDRGSQYASHDYRTLLAKHGIEISMSGKGNCLDNAPMESFFSTLKSELVHHTRFQSRAQARRELFEFIEVYYNQERLHSALGYLSPQAFEERFYLM